MYTKEFTKFNLLSFMAHLKWMPINELIPDDITFVKFRKILDEKSFREIFDEVVEILATKESVITEFRVFRLG